MKPQSVDKFTLFNICSSKNKISKLLVEVGIWYNRGRVCQIEKLDKVEVRAVKNYFCKEGMSLKEIHDNFIKTLGDEFLSYSMVNLGDGGRAWRIMNGPGALKRLLQTKMLSLCSLIMCDRRRSLCDIARKIGISFGAV